MITRQAKMVFSAYRRDEFADPDGFVLQLGVVLEAYADEVIVAVTSPRTGIQRRCKWPPSIAEVVEACEAEAARLDMLARYQAIPAPQFKRLAGPRAHPANVLAHPHAPQYAALVERAEKEPDMVRRDGQGLWVPLLWLSEGCLGQWKRPEWGVPTFDELRAHYPPKQPAREAAE